jgi:hypothetical protein
MPRAERVKMPRGKSIAFDVSCTCRTQRFDDRAMGLLVTAISYPPCLLGRLIFTSWGSRPRLRGAANAPQPRGIQY